MLELNNPDNHSPKHSIVLYDGVCKLCHGFVNYIIANDPQGLFKFAALQSEIGRKIAAEFGVLSDGDCASSPSSLPEIAVSLPDPTTVILIQSGRAYTKSTAALRILSTLSGHGGLRQIFRFLLLIPEPIRDRFYDFIATHRYGWFGRYDQCLLPTPDIKSRFL